MSAHSGLRTGVFGGSFNPVHIGHLRMAQDAIEQFELDRLIFVPCNNPPHKAAASVAEARHRVAMLELAIEGEMDLSVSRVEVDRPGISYTVDTVEELRKQFPQDALHFLLGADSLLELHTWREAGRLLERVEFITVARPGFPVDAAPALARLPVAFRDRLARNIIQGHLMDISSSDIRMRVAEGMSIRWLVPRVVEMYIREHGLYLS